MASLLVVPVPGLACGRPLRATASCSPGSSSARGLARAAQHPRCALPPSPLPFHAPLRGAAAGCGRRSASLRPISAAAPLTSTPAAAEDAPGQEDAPTLAAQPLVDELLERIEGTDAGQAASPEERERIDAIIEDLEGVGLQQQPRPIENPLLFGNYEVAYVSGGKRQKGNPAGGRFRGKVGRALFQTDGLYQNVLKPDLVVNKVAFKILGLISGFVALKGTIELLKDVGDGTDTVRAFFDKPRLKLPWGLLGYGPTSSVVLATTYLDDRVRLGRGGFGSLFVFTRGGRSDTKDGEVELGMWEPGRAGTGKGTGLVLAAALAAGAWAALRAPGVVPRVFGCLLAAASLLLAKTLARGGIEDNNVKGGKVASRDMDPEGMAEGPGNARASKGREPKGRVTEVGPGGSYTLYTFN